MSEKIEFSLHIEFRESISPDADPVVTSIGVLCKNCGKQIEPVWFNGVLSKTAWRHLHKPFRYGAGVFCFDSGEIRAEPLIDEATS